MSEALKSRSYDDVSTPALLLDLDIIESNMAAMSRLLQGGSAKFRPHFKNHKIVALARRQMEAGAIGMTVARLRHAKVLIEAGIRSILVSNEIVRETEIREWIGLGRDSEVIAVVDNASVVEHMGRIAKELGVSPPVVVDVDLGLGRTGVDPTNAVSLAEKAMKAGLDLRGVAGYDGQIQRMQPGAGKEKISWEVTDNLLRVAHELRAHGLRADIVSTGGTGTSALAAHHPGVTEIQPGTYLIMEAAYADAAPQFNLAATLLVTVISTSVSTRVVVDGGLKAISSERGLPTIKGRTGVRVKALHAEHAILDTTESQTPIRVGERIEINMQYSDATLHLHRTAYGVRKTAITDIFPVEP